MYRKILFILLFVFLIFSLSAIHAGEVNSTLSDDEITQTPDDVPLSDSEDSKNFTEFSSSAKSLYYKGDYTIVLKDSNSSSPIKGKNLRLVINNVNYSAQTADGGVARINLNLNPGKYTVYSFFDGDEDYLKCNSTDTFEILPTVVSSDITKYYKGNTPYTAKFFDSHGNLLKNKKVTISVNGKSYTKTTNNQGIASIAVNLKPGTYKVVASDPLTGYKLTTVFKILSTISASNVNKVEGDGKKFTVKFLKSSGSVLKNKYVKYKIKGKTHKVKSNSKGKVTISLKKLKKGTYKIICYNRDGLSKSYTVKVFKRKASTKVTSKDYTFVPGDNKEIQIRFSNALGDNSGKVIKIKINGKTYSRKTASDGKINFKLPSLNKGLYKFECIYDGTRYFKSSKSSHYITVFDNDRTSALTVKSTKRFGYGAGTPLKVALTAGGVPLIKRTVTLNIAGNKYNKITDEKGIVAVPITLNIGKYNVTYSSYGESYVNATSGSCEIEVFKRNPSKITWACGNSYKDSSQTFKILLKGSDGKAISAQRVTLTIDSKSYTATTSSAGYANFKSDVALGKYKVSFKFDGSNDYLGSSNSHKINVKLSKFGNGLNEKNAVAYLKAYLKSSSHCKVGSAKIKSLVKSLTKGMTNKVDKAKAIYNFVRDKIDYSFYYNTKYGSGGTLKAKKGNCVDKAHLLISMYRTAGFKARYVHGVCKFNSGHVYGHVWVQVKVGKTWICADTTHQTNSLGKIANWKTSSYKIHTKYASLPF